MVHMRWFCYITTTLARRRWASGYNTASASTSLNRPPLIFQREPLHFLPGLANFGLPRISLAGVQFAGKIRGKYRQSKRPINYYYYPRYQGFSVDWVNVAISRSRSQGLFDDNEVALNAGCSVLFCSHSWDFRRTQNLQWPQVIFKAI